MSPTATIPQSSPNHSPTWPLTNNRISLKSNIIICVHTIHDYEQQTFSWSAQQNPNQEIVAGFTQFFHSRHCSSIRGGLIGVLQAIQSLGLKHRTHIHPHTGIKICSSNSKMLSKRKRFPRTTQSPWVTLQPEHELLSTTISNLRLFTKYSLHQVTKVMAPTQGSPLLWQIAWIPTVDGTTKHSHTFLPVTQLQWNGTYPSQIQSPQN
jgi:hypothetical protein